MEVIMQATYKFAFVLAAGFALGAGAIEALHAQAKPPVYVVFEIAVKDKDGYNNNFLKDAQKLIADHGGKYVAGGYDKTVSFSGAPLPNRVGILQFANMDVAKAWQDGGGRDIQEKVGSKYADFRVFAVEGIQ
jgi:uncharacterized protein (DUF1330 family)